MNNFSISLKKILTNKNTVTLIGVLAAIVILYWGYNMRIKKAVNPISVPYATQTLAPKTRITQDMVGSIQVPPSMLKGAVITDSKNIIGRYVSAETIIPEGSLFYEKNVVSQSDLPNSIIYNYPDGWVLINMAVDTTNTYGNKIVPGNYIDIYMKAVRKMTEEEIKTTTQDKIMVGKLLENVKILGVIDAHGDNVFENLENVKTPSQLIFAAPEEIHILLRKSMYLRTYDVTLIPVPTAESLKENPGEVAVANENLQTWINEVTYWDETETTGVIQ